MLDKELYPYIRYIMRHFRCNETMAKTILDAATENGELEKIKNMCTVTTERSV